MLTVVRYPAVCLSQPCGRVADFGLGLQRLVDDLVAAMYALDGVGLAAAQVGVGQRIAVIDPSGGQVSTQLRVLINPEVTWASPERSSGEEGCLSLPGVRLQVVRPNAAQVDYDDPTGVHHRVLFNDPWAARVAQHEVDHLGGLTMLDRVGPMARKLALKGYVREHGADKT